MRTAFLISGALTLSFAVSIAIATDKTFLPSEGNWVDPNNWDPTGEPNEADRAIIPSGKKCIVTATGRHADTITVETGASGDGILQFNTNAELILDNDSAGADDSYINGLVTLGSGAKLVFADSNHMVSGNGRIQASGGNTSPAKIQIGSGLMLTNNLSVSGEEIRGRQLTIEAVSGTATFDNRGIVMAEAGEDESGTLLLASNLVLADDAAAEWGATAFENFSAKLRFDRDAESLEGDFVLPADDGVVYLDANVNVVTFGSLIYNGGKLDIQSGASFIYCGFSGSCSQPGTAYGLNICDNPYIVTTTSNCGGCP